MVLVDTSVWVAHLRQGDIGEVKYFRYIDDILILADTRWKLKQAIRVLIRTFEDLKLAKHPNKTAMDRVERGFDFLGYHFAPPGLSLAAQILANCAGKALRLYEPEPPPLRVKRLGEYLRSWTVSAGLPGVGTARSTPCPSLSQAPHRQAQESGAHQYEARRDGYG